MTEGRYDKILTKMTSRIDSVSNKIAREFEGAKPFDKEEVSTHQQLYEFYTEFPQQEPWLRQTFGNEVVDRHIEEMTKKAQRIKR